MAPCLTVLLLGSDGKLLLVNGAGTGVAGYGDVPNP